MASLLIENKNGVLQITLNRPEVRNAFDDAMIAELTEAFLNVEARVVVLAGAGKSFCAGGDLEWMRRSIDLSAAENYKDAVALGKMFETINSCACPVIGKVHGAAFGGGVGLACVCDIVIASDDAKFCFSETKLGLAPAVIAPYAIARIGEANARRYFLTAEVIEAADARRIGLAHEVVAKEQLDATVDKIIAAILSNGPNAVSTAKALIRSIAASDPSDLEQMCAEAISSLRVSPEGQEGVRSCSRKFSIGTRCRPIRRFHFFREESYAVSRRWSRR
jgi:methylglutaconyl-CoA hydratase